MTLPRFALRLAVFALLMGLVAGCAENEKAAQLPPTSTVAITATQASNLPAQNERAPTSTPSSLSTFESSTDANEEIEVFAYPTRGASEALDTDNDDSLNWDEYEQAVRDLVIRFPWPPGYQVTADFILSGVSPEDHSATYQPGYEFSPITLVWTCVWMKTWLVSRNGVNPALEAQAIEYLVNTWPQSVEDDYSRNAVENIGQQILLNDPTAVIDFVNRPTICGGLGLERFETPTP